MIEESIERLAGLGVWAPVVPEFLRSASTLRWLTVCQAETRKSDDETVLVLLAAMRALELTVVDGTKGPEELSWFLDNNDEAIRRLCRNNRVQANVAERALPVLELLGQQWGRQKLFVTELGSSFGLLGRVLVSAPETLQNFGRYFTAGQQRPQAVPLVTGYRGIDLAPPDERWLLACIPVPELRTRVARFIYEVPADPRCTVVSGSAFDLSLWPEAPKGATPIVLTSFMLYQLTEADRRVLVSKIQDHVAEVHGSWINLDVRAEDGKSRFVVEVDGIERLELENDLCIQWRSHGR